MTAGCHLPLLGLFWLLFAAMAAFAVAIPQGGRRWWSLSALLALFVSGGMLLSGGWVRSLLLDASAFIAVALVWVRGTPEAARAGQRYLGLLIVAVLCLTGGMFLAHGGTSSELGPWARLAVGLLAVGVGLKLALVPFYGWLPGVAAVAAPMTTVLIVSVVDVAAFTELMELRAAIPWVFAAHRPLWLALALASMIGGALLALAQHDLKRMLAFSTIDDMGYLLLGVVAGSEAGLAGAIAGAAGHAVSKLLLFGAVGMAEAQLGRPLTLECRGQAARCPVAGAAFILGSLGILGVPPTFGFVGRWRLYLAGAELGGVGLVLLMVLATSLALLCYARAIHRVWLGAAAETAVPQGPRAAAVALSVLMAAVVALGLFPGMIPWGAP